jgi:hypothetical protein
LEDGYLSSLDPKVFDTIIRASDQGLAMDAPRVRDIVTAGLDSGRLHVPRIETVMSINAGQMRVANAVADVDGAKLAAAGNFDLIQQQVDLRITLTGPERNDGSSGRPDIFVGLKGPVLTPQRTVDVSALAGWLTIRRIDQQAKKLEALEAAQREQEAARERAARARPVSPAPAAASAPPIQPAEPSVAAPVTAPAPAAPVRRPLHEAARPAPAKPAAPAAVRSRAVAPPAPRAIEARPSPSAEPESPPSTAALPQAAPVVPLAPALEPHAPAVPPLPAPREIRSIPRGPDRVQGSAVQPPSEPLRLPSSQPSVLDSLVGPQR